ncbi:hypothetical protein L3X37_01305 [Sabulilitoribacter arenilitoris]|uniref:NlpE C-terminal OB domain-containing protein n=1 Tax=Wocania arenilitoris TaxID=2044858 RepID=A0AAE3EK59_9FLAO|nr:hypothetical protein [Wocania arenilitoris]MCF7567001.1 hypothetical protein [Wocania arenilitoris]
MKNVLIVIICFSAFFNCKNEKKTDENISTENSERTEKQSDGLTLLKGDFVYYADAAILQTHAEIYGVILNNKVDELNDKAKAFKKEATDFVLVEVRGKITQKPEGEEGWDNRLEIIEILSVKPASKEKNNVVQSGKE